MIGLGLLFLTYSVLHTLFAFREPPSVLRSWFKVEVPFLLGLLLLLVPEKHTIKVARLALGAIFLIASVFMFSFA